MNISIKNYTEIASLLPHDCLYIDYHGAYSKVKVIIVATVFTHKKVIQFKPTDSVDK